MDPTLITTKELEKLIHGKTPYILIDVREKDELEHGMIPTAIHIPLHDIETALTTVSEEEWKLQYNKSKPTSNDTIIVYCRTGGRSTIAATILKNTGFLNVKNYKGSVQEWSEVDENVEMY